LSKQKNPFKTKVVPAKPGSGKLFEEIFEVNNGPVVCLGQEFENDAARREHFTALLREKLKDPEFRKIEGFPIGDDDVILALSDPPYYTACPNPWIADFIKEWESQKSEKTEDYKYHREPFAADVREGRNDHIYNAHSYHTKTPHKAIMRFILHYTEPGDIVFDGFCGTGMTGVAAQMCGDREVIMSLGYQVKTDGTILQEETDKDGKRVWQTFSKLGVRRAVLNDLSPAATFIAYNYNTPVDIAAFGKEVKRILKEVKEECGWMYETLHTDGKSKCEINFVIWSDVYICPECTNEVVFWDVAVDEEVGAVLEDFRCSHCQTMLSKEPANQKRESAKPVSDRRPVASKIDRAWNTKFDNVNGTTIKNAKQATVLINYSYKGKRYQKAPDSIDIELLNKIENTAAHSWIPIARMPEGKESRRNDPLGMTHVHLYFTKRNLLTLSACWSKAKLPELKFLLTSLMFKSSHLCGPLMSNYFAEVQGNSRGGWVGKDRSGTLYCPSIHSEVSIFPQIKSRARSTVINIGHNSGFAINTSSALSIPIPENSQDYVFIDPPFGSNINYSEMSFLWEAWLGVYTNIKTEAIENTTQEKGLNEYRQLITECFKTSYYILKPGHWITVEFSNTKASVWNSIQTALTGAGFIVANVSALNKKQGSINAYTTSTAVKQDLVISAYKPNGGFEARFEKEAQKEEGVWNFVRTHLKYLPVIKKQGLDIVVAPERDPRILFDQVVAYYVRKGYLVPVSSQEFQIGLSQRFSERDGMYFLPEQVAEYDRKKMISGGRPIQLSLFVSDEFSTITWLRNLLHDKPQSFQDLNPQFMKAIGGWKKTEKGLELSTLLEQNFLCYDGKGKVPEQIHGYLSTNWKDMRNLQKDDPALIAKAKNRWYVPDPNKAGDLEKLREKDLLKEFEEYKESKKKLKLFRLEAVRAGFKKCWQERDYANIISVAEKIPNNILEEDPKLLMWYDQAVTRSGAGI
jgi:hypothetical protein